MLGGCLYVCGGGYTVNIPTVSTSVRSIHLEGNSICGNLTFVSIESGK